MVLLLTLFMGIAMEFLLIRYLKYGFYITLVLLIVLSGIVYHFLPMVLFLKSILYGLTPLLFIAIVLYVFVAKEETTSHTNERVPQKWTLP